jgi:hypothetical protein
MGSRIEVFFRLLQALGAATMLLAGLFLLIPEIGLNENGGGDLHPGELESALLESEVCAGAPDASCALLESEWLGFGRFNAMSVEASAEESGPMDELDSEWQHKGATFSDKMAREEFGLTQDDIVRAIRAGTLHYREGSVYGKGILMLFAIICFFLARARRETASAVHPVGITVLRARLVSVLTRP